MSHHDYLDGLHEMPQPQTQADCEIAERLDMAEQSILSDFSFITNYSPTRALDILIKLTRTSNQ